MNKTSNPEGAKSTPRRRIALDAAPERVPVSLQAALDRWDDDGGRPAKVPRTEAQ